ncbi:MAG TPA: tetratricopeptide repeat protein [Isosphaeraceae bacterium]|jgi:tetratricopeptide (TPR) repeat protein|nr:tetratricopeptide repeat protein [Isosphaeraceae bacterium]
MRGFVAERVRIMSLLLAALLAFPAAAASQKSKGPTATEKAKGRVGERVVLKPWVSSLKSGNHGIAVKGFQVYRVRMEKGSMLLLAPEDVGLSGWVGEDDVVALDEAVDYLTREIERQPSARLYNFRATVRIELDDFEDALKDCDEVVRLDPGYAVIYSVRGVILNRMGRYDEALASFGESIRLEPNAITHANRGFLRVQMKDYKGAIDDFTEAIRRDRKESVGLAGRAWVRATCPDAKFRDGPRAVDGAKAACELTEWKSAFCLDVLAEATAEVGDFKAAVKWEKKALEYEPKDGGRRTDMEKRLALFQSGKPYRYEPKPRAKPSVDAPKPGPETKESAGSK